MNKRLTDIDFGIDPFPESDVLSQARGIRKKPTFPFPAISLELSRQLLIFVVVCFSLIQPALHTAATLDEELIRFQRASNAVEHFGGTGLGNVFDELEFAFEDAGSRPSA